MEFNWRDEQSVNITSDLSSFEDEEREAGDASTTTLTQDVSVNNLAAGEVRTPAASNPPNLCSSEPATGRLSLSQPELPIDSTPPTRVARLNMSTGNICSPSGKPPRPSTKPLSQTLEENKRLREEIAVLKSKLDVEQYKVAELKSLQPREVQDILEEYYSLQMSKFDLDDERKQMAEERRQNNLEMERIEVRAQTKIEALQRKLHESETKCQSVIHELEQYKERVRVLEAEIAKFDELPTSIDGLKGDDSDWTIRSEGDIVSEELRRRLFAMEKENNALRRKIDEQTKELEEKLTMLSEAMSQSKIDHLEGCLRVEEEERNKTSSALVAYMSRCHALEKKIRNANLSYSNLSFTAHNKEEVLRLVEKVRDVLRVLGKQNKELRKECTFLLGLQDQSDCSTDSSAASGKPDRVDRSIVEKTNLFAEDFEKKQQEILESLKTLADNVSNYDESVLNILKGIGATDDTADIERCGGDAVVAEVPASPERINVSQQKIDPSNATNLSMMNASLMDLMSRSMNTSKEIVTFKTKLVSLRDVMHQMFENLKSSGVLFEDVLELLGSGTEEMRSLADRIRAMKFEWNSAIEEKRVVMDAIEETVVSVNRMQTELSAWEQSLNETSFRLDISIAQTTTECYSVQTARADEGGDSSMYQKNSEEMQKQISLKTEEINHMRSTVEEAREARDLALSTADDLQSTVKQMEARLISMAEERERLISTIEADEAEKLELKELIESQLKLNEEVQRDMLQLRSEADALNKELAAKEVLVVELEAKVAAAKDSNASLKEVIAERESKLGILRAALDEEQERRQEEHENWKNDLARAQGTSSALRRDLERIRNELNTKDERIRCLQDQLRCVEENNYRMAEVVSSLASDENKGARNANANPLTAVVGVQTTALMAKTKSRDAQTDLTRTTLAQMECDAVSYSSELDALRSAYTELREAVGQLVVKNIKPLPDKSGIASIEKSCKELSRLIHHERRRRENQANELAAMTAKIEELRQKGLLEVPSGTPLKVASATPASDAAAEKAKKFDDPNRKTLFVLTAMAMDLVKQLRRLSLLHTAGKQIDFTAIIDLARKLRNELNDRFLIVRSEKENENKHCVSDLVHMVKILERDNRTLHENVKAWQKEYEALQKQNAGNPELTERIESQLRSIHSVMGEFRRVCGELQDPSNNVKAAKGGPAQ
uniref:Centrosomal protein of n=1 Tax=Haemonchus contortus TaxID=6289 RepID=A0A7I4YLB3_HAECO